MKNLMMVICVGGVLFCSISSLAKQPAGLEKKGKVPEGFTKGKKGGWQNENPPGWDKKNEKEKKEWKGKVKQARSKISKVAKQKGMSKKEAESAADDFEKCARKGVSCDESESLVKGKIMEGKKGEELSDASAEETKKRLRKKNQNQKRHGKHMKKGKGKGKGK